MKSTTKLTKAMRNLGRTSSQVNEDTCSRSLGHGPLPLKAPPKIAGLISPNHQMPTKATKDKTTPTAARRRLKYAMVSEGFEAFERAMAKMSGFGCTRLSYWALREVADISIFWVPTIHCLSSYSQ